MLQTPYGSIPFAAGELPRPRHIAMRGPAGWQALAKRMLDLLGASCALLLLSVPLLIAALAIRLDSPGPVLFRQRRIGLDNQPFEMWKLRTMRCTAAETGRLRQACPHDPRITRVGGFLRRTSLDEVPQFVHVLRGQMSLVGPRPHAPGTCAGDVPFEHVSPHYAQRHRVLPGITGLAQVRGWRGETDTQEKLLRRLDSDLEYIATWSLRLDLLVLWRTLGSVLRMHNAY